MKLLIAHVRDGRIRLDEPTELPDGTEVALAIVSDEDDYDAEDRARLNAALLESEADMAAGRMIDVRDALARVRAKR